MMMRSIAFILLLVFLGHARPVDDKIKVEDADSQSILKQSERPKRGGQAVAALRQVVR